MGVFLCVVIVVPLLVGLRIDEAHHSTPVGFGLGLVLGAVNPLVVQLLLRLGLPASSTNMTRLGVFSAVVVAAGFAVGVSRAWLLIIGVAAAQMVTAVTAAVEMIRR